MIEDPYPQNWPDLQNGVGQIFNEIGLTVEIGKVVTTPRGNIELDVYAVDEDSVDKIKYIVECKNWATAIPQTVVHAFTTVMHEVGGNIGYIISKEGLQTGAIEYTKSTNITGLSYEEFQRKYFSVWFERFFIPQIGDTVDALTQYVEPINSRREKKIKQLSDEKKKEFRILFNRYFGFGISMAFFEFPRYSPEFAVSSPENIEELKSKFAKLGDEFNFKSKFIRDLLSEIKSKVSEVTNSFHEIFGENIFA